MFTISYHPSSEYQVGAAIELDLAPYIESIEKKIAMPTPENLEEYEKTYDSFFQLVQPIVCELRWAKWFDTAFQGTKLPSAIIEQIKQSPAYKISAEISAIEILKNSMDECLFAYFNPSCKKKSHLVQIVMAIGIDDEQVHFKFSDSGRGFSESFLSRVQDNSHKAQYLCQSDSHRRRIKDDSEPLFKSFGGHGIGLRELISLVHCGQHLSEIKSNIITASSESASRLIQEGMATNYRVDFYNQSGACISLVTPYFEQKVRDKSIVFHEKDRVDPSFKFHMPNFKLHQKSSLWSRSIKSQSDDPKTLEFN